MAKKRRLIDLCEYYDMHPKTFKRHTRAILVKNSLRGAKVSTILPQMVVDEIVSFMGDEKGLPGSKTMTELAVDYGVHRVTLSRWLRPISHTLKAKVRGRYILSTRDLSEIYNFLGKPGGL